MYTKAGNILPKREIQNSKIQNKFLFECFNSSKQIYLFIYLFPPSIFSHVAPKVTNQPQENLVKSGYKTNRKEKKSRNPYYMLVNH
jgi:hypothetical protein